jgi:hypothetical protein
MSESDQPMPWWLTRVIEALAAGAAGGGGYLVGGIPGAVVGAAGGPALVEAMEVAAHAVRARRASNISAAVIEAGEKADLTPEALLERLVATPDRQELFAAAVEAAGRATLDTKVKALGQSLATGALGDGERVDHELLFVHAMAEFERPHIRILEYLRRDPERPGELRQAIIHELARLPGVGAAVHPLLGTLQRHGTVEQYRVDPEAIQRGADMRRMVPADGSWSITDFGMECLDRLQAAATAPHAQSNSSHG